MTNRYRDARQEPTPDGPCMGPRKKRYERLWEIVKTHGPFAGLVMHRALTEADAAAWVEKQNRSYGGATAQYEIRQRIAANPNTTGETK